MSEKTMAVVWSKLEAYQKHKILEALANDRYSQEEVNMATLPFVQLRRVWAALPWSFPYRQINEVICQELYGQSIHEIECYREDVYSSYTVRARKIYWRTNAQGR